jgi:sporulation protein YlmC with PRC-barrel domain
MLKQLLSTTALVLVLSAPAWAQTATSDDPAATGQGQTTEEMNVQPMEQPEGAMGEAPGAAETQPQVEEPATGTAEMEQPAAGSDEAVITEQKEGQMKAEDLMGMTVVSGQGEEIGQVRDLIFDQNEKITGVVVGVGGFLGIGAKNVALNWDQAEVQQNPDTGEEVILVTLTREELEAAPEFKTAEEKQAEEEAAQQETGGVTQPLPDTDAGGLQ